MELTVAGRCRCMGDHVGHGTTAEFIPEKLGFHFPTHAFLTREIDHNGSISGRTKAIYTVGSQTVSLQTTFPRVLNSGEKVGEEVKNLPDSITNSNLLSEFEEGEKVEILCDYMSDKLIFQKAGGNSEYYPADFSGVDFIKKIQENNNI